MNDYARATGRTGQPAGDNRPAPQKKPLSDAEIARCTEAKAFVLERMPELVPFLRDLVAEGMVPGWRGVINCRLV